jgi:hypothetical protein
MPGPGLHNLDTNLLYRLDSNGVAEQMPYPGDLPQPLVPTQIVPFAALETRARFVGAGADGTLNATDTVDPYDDPGDLLDGDTMTIGDGDITLTYEFDCGPDVRLDPTGPQAVRDGQTFLLSDGDDAEVFEFDSGPVLVTGNGLMLRDGDWFEIQDDSGTNRALIFEFEQLAIGDGVAAGNIPIDFVGFETTAQVIDLIVTAINNAAPLNVVANGFSPDGIEGRISLINDVFLQIPPASAKITLPNDHNDLVVTAITAGPQWANIDVVFQDISTMTFNASATVAPLGGNNDFVVTAVTPGDTFDGIDVNFTHNPGVGDQATVTFNSGAGTLAIEIDPGVTTANTVIAAFGTIPEFTAALENIFDDGAGTIDALGTLATTSGGATPSGDQAIATFDPVTGTLTIFIDPDPTTGTTANTVVAAVIAEGTFTAALGNPDPANDGTGTIDNLGLRGRTSGGSALVMLDGDHNNLTVTGPNNTDIVFADGAAGSMMIARQQRPANHRRCGQCGCARLRQYQYRGHRWYSAPNRSL